MNTIYFYCGMLLGLRANEQRFLRFFNIVVKENFIIFDQSISKTFHGGLSDLGLSAKLIKYMCHETGVTHSHCLQSLFYLYLDKIGSVPVVLKHFIFGRQETSLLLIKRWL